MTSLFSRMACLAALTAMVSACIGATIVQGRSASDVYLSNQAFVNDQIVTVTLPGPGQYVALGRVSIVNWTGQQESVRCSISVSGGAPLNSAVTVTGGPYAPSAAGVTTQAKVTTTIPNQPLKLQCTHDRPVSGIKAASGASLVVSDASPGVKGPQGITGVAGPTGAPGPSSATKTAVCVGLNAIFPMTQSCSCPTGKLAKKDTNFVCSATGGNLSCTATGVEIPNGGGIHYPACCECLP